MLIIKRLYCALGEISVEGEMLPTILGASHLKTNKDARKLAAIALVAAGYAGDMDEELANELTSLTSVATRQILS